MVASSNLQSALANQRGLSVGPQFDRKCPAFVSQMLRKFGRTPYGEPLFRVVWSETRLEQVLLYTGQYGWQRRYEGDPCWMLEKWLPTSYSREQWYELFSVKVSDPVSSELWSKSYLGPYLEFGDYHPCYRLERHGQPMPLTLAIIEYYCRLIEAGKEATAAQKRMAIRERHERAQREWSNRCDDIFDDAQPAFGVQSIMSGYGAKTSRVKPEDVSLASAEALPSWVPRTPGFSQF